jgi:hypothetical protein
MKIKTAKLANAIKIGTKEVHFIVEKDYDIELEGFFLKITEKIPSHPASGRATSCTSLFNTVYWQEHEIGPSVSAKSGGASGKVKSTQPAATL